MENPINTLTIGDKLPDLMLPVYDPKNDEDTHIETKNLRGKWMIFFFYPADFTFVCPTELEEMAGLHEEFKKEEAEIFSVSTDTVYVHKAWHDVSETIRKIEFPMIADTAAQICTAYGTIIPMEGISLRATVIIDPDGAVKAFEIQDNSIGRSAKELVRKIKAAHSPKD